MLKSFKNKIGVYLIKKSLGLIEFTPTGHSLIEPILNKWVDDLNKHYYETRS